VIASDGIEGLELVSRHVIQPDLSLADYNLPNIAVSTLTSP